MMRFVWTAGVLAAVIALPAKAQDALPDPDSIELPPMTFGDDASVAKNGYKFFFHHNPDISFADAYRDVAQCLTQTERQSTLMLPGFVPWSEENRSAETQADPMFGLVGVALSAIIAPKMERGARNAAMRMCLERRGYVRYALDEAAYDMLWDGDPAEITGKLAKTAIMTPPTVATLDVHE